jgi:hypothetical protein
MDTLDDQNIIFCLFHVSTNFARQLAIGNNVTRYQRAPEGSNQSSTDRGDQIVYGRGMRLTYLFRLSSIIFGNGPVNAEDYPLRLTSYIGIADWPLLSFNRRFRDIDNLAHHSPPGHDWNNSHAPQ